MKCRGGEWETRRHEDKRFPFSLVPNGDKANQGPAKTRILLLRIHAYALSPTGYSSFRLHRSSF
jgi:hypothetical protein